MIISKTVTNVTTSPTIRRDEFCDKKAFEIGSAFVDWESILIFALQDSVGPRVDVALEVATERLNFEVEVEVWAVVLDGAAMAIDKVGSLVEVDVSVDDFSKRFI